VAESAIDRSIGRELARRGAWGTKTHGTAAGRRGIPDWLICHRGAFLAVETKQPGGATTRLQRHELERVHRAGGEAIVARSAGDVRQALDDIERRHESE
jgi:Holliday junction resolvase